MKQCPHCSELILDIAARCRFCGKDLAGQDPVRQDWEPFLRRYKTGYSAPATQRQIWEELTQEQQEYLVAEFGISPPKMEAPMSASPVAPPAPKKRSIVWAYVFVGGIAWIGLVVMANLRNTDPNRVARGSGTEERYVGKWESSQRAIGYEGIACIEARNVLLSTQDPLIAAASIDSIQERLSNQTSVSDYSVALSVMLDELKTGSKAEKEMARFFTECSRYFGIEESPPW